MKKFLLSLLTAAATFGYATAADVTDVITAANLPATGSQYVDFSNITSVSAAQYSGSTAKSVDIQIKKGTVFIWTTTSGGTIKSISIEYKKSSAARNIDIYAANTAFSGSVSGNATATLSSSSLTWTPASTENYTYFALKNATSNAAYLSKIEVVWTPAPIELGEIMVGEEIANNLTPTIYSGEKIKFTCDNATSISYTAENDNYNFSDEVQGAEIEWEAPSVTTATEYLVSVTAKDDSKTAEATLMVTVKPERATTSLTFANESLEHNATEFGAEVDGVALTITPEMRLSNTRQTSRKSCRLTKLQANSPSTLWARQSSRPPLKALKHIATLQHHIPSMLIPQNLPNCSALKKTPRSL